MKTVPVLTQLLRDGAVPADQQADAVAVIGRYASPEQLGDLLAVATSSGDTNLISACLRTLLQVNDQRKVRPIQPVSGPETIAGLLKSGDEDVRGLAARCVGAWKLAPLRGELIQMLRDPSVPESVLEAAIEGIAAFGGREDSTLLERLTAPENPQNVRQRAAIALLGLRPALGVGAALDLMQDPDDADQLEALFQEFLRRRAIVDQVTRRLSGLTISPDVAVIGMRAVNSSGQQLPEFAAALQQAGGITTGPKKLTPEQMQALVADVEAHGNPAAGEAVYRRKDLNCLKCHAIGGVGGNVGPDMISLGTTAQLDYLVDALLDPNKQVKENYHTMIVLDEDGRTYSGIVVRQTDDALLLRDAEGQEQAVPLASIEQQQQGVSLMPAGLTDKLTRGELIDLVAFLKALGRLPEFSVTQRPLIRNWEVMQTTEQAAHRLRRVSYAAAATDDSAFTWLRGYSRVGGSLPVDELPTLSVENRSAPGSRGVAFVRTQFASDENPVRLAFDDVTGLTAWWDGQPLELAKTVDLPTTTGERRLTLAIDLDERSDELTIERSADVNDN